ncbi:hypothetical protein BC830DRAFT_1129713, partial [Chytriomyces sp. MP71]
MITFLPSQVARLAIHHWFFAKILLAVHSLTTNTSRYSLELHPAHAVFIVKPDKRLPRFPSSPTNTDPTPHHHNVIPAYSSASCTIFRRTSYSPKPCRRRWRSQRGLRVWCFQVRGEEHPCLCYRRSLGHQQRL